MFDNSLGYPLRFDAAREVWSARSFPTGDFEVKYSYELEDDSSLARFILTTRLEVAHDEPGAREIFQEGVDAMAAGATKVGGRFVSKGNLQNWSENAYVGFTLAEPNETIVGCLLPFQKQRMIYTILLRGVVLEDAGEIEEIVYPFLEAAFAWSHRDA